MILMRISGDLVWNGLCLHGAKPFGHGMRRPIGMLVIGLEEKCPNRDYTCLALLALLLPLPQQ
jgi:hypothetical protein